MGTFEHFPAQKVLKHLTDSEAAIAANSEAIEELKTSAVPTEFHEWGVRENTYISGTRNTTDYNESLNCVTKGTAIDKNGYTYPLQYKKTFNSYPTALTASATACLIITNSSSYDIIVACNMATSDIKTIRSELRSLSVDVDTYYDKTYKEFEIPKNSTATLWIEGNITGAYSYETNCYIYADIYAWIKSIENFTATDDVTEDSVLEQITIKRGVLMIDGSYYPS